VTPEATAAVEAIMKENHGVTVNEIAAHLDRSHGSAHHIVYDFSAVLQDAAEIVKHFKILVTCFSARVSRNAGILT
jgi:hypothetical protein